MLKILNYFKSLPPIFAIIASCVNGVRGYLYKCSSVGVIVKYASRVNTRIVHKAQCTIIGLFGKYTSRGNAALDWYLVLSIKALRSNIVYVYMTYIKYIINTIPTFGIIL